jgi:hypothetical protein
MHLRESRDGYRGLVSGPYGREALGIIDASGIEEDLGKNFFLES